VIRFLHWSSCPNVTRQQINFTLVSQPHIQLLSRHHCGLCEEAQAVVVAVAEQGLCTWETVNVDSDKALLVRYGMDVPVLLVGGVELFRHRVSAEALKTSLATLSSESIT